MTPNGAEQGVILPAKEQVMVNSAHPDRYAQTAVKVIKGRLGPAEV